MEKYVVVMKPLVSITEAIGAEKWVTVSMLRPLLYKLRHIYLVENSGDSRIEVALKKAILSDLQDRYVGESLLFLTKAAFLDPRFKILGFLSTNEREEAIEEIRKEAAALAEHIAAVGNVDSALNSDKVVGKQSEGEHTLMKLLNDVVQGSSSTTEDGQLSVTPYQRASMEVNRYTGEVTAEVVPVYWWKDNSSKYPILSKLCRKYLSIQATSVSAERAFSSIGNIITSKRSCLLPESVEMLTFLAANLK